MRYCLPWGNFSTQAIDIEPDATVETLQGKIFEKFNIPIKKQLIKFKRDGFTVTFNASPRKTNKIGSSYQWVDSVLLRN